MKPFNFFKTFSFWNNQKIAQYFKEKPADHRVRARLEKLDKNQRNNMNALDLGCGGGRHTELLIELGFKTYIFDFNPQMLKCTIARVGESALAGVGKGSIVRLPYADNMFDIVVTTGVLHQAKNLDEYEKAIMELARVIKPSGVVCLNIFTSSTIDTTLTKMSNAFVYETKESLGMTLLSKNLFYELMEWHGLFLENEISEGVVNENTGPRSVLRCNFIKK